MKKTTIHLERQRETKRGFEYEWKIMIKLLLTEEASQDFSVLSVGSQHQQRDKPDKKNKKSVFVFYKNEINENSLMSMQECHHTWKCEELMKAFIMQMKLRLVHCLKSFG